MSENLSEKLTLFGKGIIALEGVELGVGEFVVFVSAQAKHNKIIQRRIFVNFIMSRL